MNDKYGRPMAATAENGVHLWNSMPPSECDLCGRDITTTFVDGRTLNMCSECHRRLGAGLGTGLGQQYELQGNEWVKTAG